TVLTCSDCGYVFKCPNCDVPLTYHKHINKLKCHYCNYEMDKVEECSKCHSKRVNSFGMGTEKLEQEINNIFKDAKTIRMDVDTTSKKGSHERIINDFDQGLYDILIGTQMIAKGLDFPNVTLVGVINGDATLNIPDFRNAERTFQLLNQVAGRAGRSSKKGNVIIQGFNIDHYSIMYASKHDYMSFYNEEMKIRKILKYPPFCNLAFIYLTGKNLDTITIEGNKITKFLKDKLNDTVVLGPSIANIPKINNIYHMQVIIKYKTLKDIYKCLDYLNNHYKDKNNINVEIDINPLRI
ncbi:MAG TPA: primosomal protein N', partial [Bacilli bacterium]|nr:primosomal protein N' [Bacilli bacterium]